MGYKNNERADSTSVHTSNGHREHRNGDRAAGEFNGDNTSPLPTGMMTMKPTKARYMAPTESAKAKYRSSSNPKTRSANLVESPTGKQPKRYSLGGQQAKIDHSPRTDHSPKTALNTQHQQRNSTFQVHIFLRYIIEFIFLTQWDSITLMLTTFRHTSRLIFSS